MQELEKMLEEINNLYVDETDFGVECNMENRSDIACDNCYECIKEACKNIIRKHMNDGWIPAWKPPESEKEVLILTDRGTITTAIYEDGTVPEERSIWAWTDIDFIYDEDNDINYIPKGWWEYRHFNPDDIYNNVVDENVIAWQPLPEPYRPERSEE